MYTHKNNLDQKPLAENNYCRQSCNGFKIKKMQTQITVS